MTLVCILAAVLQLRSLFALGLAFAAAAVWSTRIPSWNMRAAWVMMFWGSCGFFWGLGLMLWSVDLSWWLLRIRLHDIPAFFGPIIMLIGMFYVCFGAVHVLLAVVSDD